MPRATTVRTSQRQRPTPYGTRSTSHSMATQLVSTYSQQPYSPWEQSPYDQTHMLPMSMYQMPPLEPSSLHAPQEIPTQSSHQRHQPRNSQSVPWTAQEDDCLLKSKRQGLQWDAIHKKYFPDKSGNACRKRYERLENKRRGTDWDEARLQRLAVAYTDMRQQIWGPLAKRLGEKWEHVEKKVHEEGVKALINKASYHSRQISTGSSKSHHSGYDLEYSSPQDEYEQENQGEDENGDSGIGLGPDSGNRHESSRVGHHHDSSTLDPGSLHDILQPPMYRH